MTSKTELAERLAETILAEIRESDDLSNCEEFSDLHAECDANTLGETEAYYEQHGLEVIEMAQQIVSEALPLTELIEIRLLSSGMINTPGLVEWLACVYTTDPQMAIKMLSACYELSHLTAEALLSGEIDYDIEGDSVTFKTESR